MDKKRSEYVDDDQSKREKALALVREQLERSFSGSSELSITKSKNGRSRIRAHLPDSDTEMIDLANSYYSGIIEINEDNGSKAYIVEQYFPHHREKPTYFWAFTPSSNDLHVAVETNGVVDGINEADITDAYQFLRFMEEIAEAFQFEDYERSELAKEGYKFTLEDLQ